MSEVIVVTSGKGGVGKTTTSAAFATGLAMRGHKTVVVDFDVGLPSHRRHQPGGFQRSRQRPYSGGAG